MKNLEYFMWVVAVASLIATVANIYKKKWCWHVWVLSNVAWAGYDFYIGAYAQGCLMGTYGVLAIWGLLKWRK